MAEDDKHLPGRPGPAPAKILTADLFISDEPVRMPSAEELQEMPEAQRRQYEQVDVVLTKFLQKYGVQRGGKISLTKDEYQEMIAVLSGIDISVVPGGSTADIFSTFARLDKTAQVKFVGAIGHGYNDNIIRDDLSKAGIALATPDIPGAEGAVSFIFKDPDGKRTFATYAGNAAEVVKPDMISDSLMEESNVVFIQDSLWRKFGSELPETILDKALRQNKEIWLSMPRQAKFHHEIPAETFERLMPAADVILVDEEELKDIYKTDDLELAIRKLQMHMAAHASYRVQFGAPHAEAVKAFVKRADNSATVLTSATASAPARREEIAAPEGVQGRFSTLGAGDAAYAGFLVGHVHGRSAGDAGRFAIQVAKEKYRYDSERIPINAETEKRLEELEVALRASAAPGAFPGDFSKSQSKPVGIVGWAKDLVSAKKFVSTFLAVGFIFIWTERILTSFKTGFSLYQDIPRMLTGRSLDGQPVAGGRRAPLNTLGKNVKSLFTPHTPNFIGDYTNPNKFVAAGGILGLANNLWFFTSSRRGEIPEGKDMLARLKTILKNPKDHAVQVTALWSTLAVIALSLGRVADGVNYLSVVNNGVKSFNPKQAMSGLERVTQLGVWMPLVGGCLSLIGSQFLIYSTLNLKKPGQEKTGKHIKATGNTSSHYTGSRVNTDFTEEQKNSDISFARSHSIAQSSGSDNRDNSFKNFITMFTPSNIKNMVSFAAKHDPIGLAARILALGVDLGYIGVGLATIGQINAGKFTKFDSGTRKYIPVPSSDLAGAKANALQSRNVGILGFGLTVVYIMYVYDTLMHAYKREQEKLKEPSHGQQMAR